MHTYIHTHMHIEIGCVISKALELICFLNNQEAMCRIGGGIYGILWNGADPNLNVYICTNMQTTICI